MKEQLIIFRLVVSLVLLVAVAPGTTPTMAAQPRRTVPVAPNPAADLSRGAAVRRITPGMHTGNVGRFAGEARSQVRVGDLRPRLGPSSSCEVISGPIAPRPAARRKVGATSTRLAGSQHVPPPSKTPGCLSIMGTRAQESCMVRLPKQL